MFKKMIITTLVSASALVLPLTSFAASSVIGVKTFNTDSSAVFNFFNSTGTDQGSTNVAITDVTSQVAYADLINNPGLETISYYDQYNYNTVLNSVVMIADQAGTMLDTFYPFGEDQVKPAVLAVGELTDEYSGPEIAVCRTSSTLPEVKVYNYSETDGAVEVLSFYPFGEGTTAVRGCGGLAFGDMDGDGQTEIVIGKYEGKVIKIFDQTGTLKYTVKFLKGQSQHLGIDTFFSLIGNSTTNEDNIVIYSAGRYNDPIYIVDKTDTVVSTIDWQSIAGNYTIKQIVTGDTDGDGVEELIVLQSGRKGKVRLLSITGEEQGNFQTDPNATSKVKRSVYFGDFSTD